MKFHTLTAAAPLGRGGSPPFDVIGFTCGHVGASLRWPGAPGFRPRDEDGYHRPVISVEADVGSLVAPALAMAFAPGRGIVSVGKALGARIRGMAGGRQSGRNRIFGHDPGSPRGGGYNTGEPPEDGRTTAGDFTTIAGQRRPWNVEGKMPIPTDPHPVDGSDIAGSAATPPSKWVSVQFAVQTYNMLATIASRRGGEMGEALRRSIALTNYIDNAVASGARVLIDRNGTITELVVSP